MCPLSLNVFWLLALVTGSPPDCVPRRYVSYHEGGAKVFREDGVFNYSTMLLREDLGVLMLGARGTVIGLDLNDISRKRGSVKWEVTKDEHSECQMKRKSPEVCRNYIKILHKMADSRTYVCGTRAFAPQCDYMTFSDGTLTLEKKPTSETGQCPHDPAWSFASLMDGDVLYTALYEDFLHRKPLLRRNFPNPIRTDISETTNPNFVSMDQVPESWSDGGAGQVYLFFHEKFKECDCFKNSAVSRVARICKGDKGGRYTLQDRFATFLKARMDCPVLDSELPYIIQDTYLWCDPEKEPSDCLFYGVFTPQLNTAHMSTVCSYLVSDINAVFEGGYKEAYDVVGHVREKKWLMFTGDVPNPRPGACSSTSTLDLPDKTVTFVKNRPLMDQAVQPVGGKPLLVRQGATFTRLVVNQVEAADGKTYHVMFIGTVGGAILKAVNYDGEMFIIEEVQLFRPQEPIKSLKISSVKRQLYAVSDSGAAQIPLATCGRSSSCVDCVLARDPYCGWDQVAARCVAISDGSRLIQSVQGQASLCPRADAGSRSASEPTLQSFWPGGNLMLSCPPPSNLAKIRWERDGVSVSLSDRVQQLEDRLIILDASESDGGRYRCLAVERTKSREHTTTVAEYRLAVAPGEEQCVSQWTKCLYALVPVLFLLFAILAWNFYKGQVSLPCKAAAKTPTTASEEERPV